MRFLKRSLNLSKYQIVAILSFAQMLRGFIDNDTFDNNNQNQLSEQIKSTLNNHSYLQKQFTSFGSSIIQNMKQSDQNEEIQPLTLFSQYETKDTHNLNRSNYQKRNLASVKLIHGSNMRSIVRNKYSNSQYSTTITQVQALNSFLILGYFKSTSAISKKIPLILVGVQKDYYNFLNFQFLNSTHVQLKTIQANNLIKIKTQMINTLQNTWNCFGIIYSKQVQQAKFVYSDTNSKLYSSVAITSVILSPSITTLDVCITCNLEGGVYSKFVDEVSTVKIIYNVDINLIANFYLFNEININKTQILSNSFNFNNYIPNSEYLMSQSYYCDSGYSFFEGICITQTNCQNLIFESDINSQFETGKYFNTTAQKCMNCGSNCLKCTSSSVCTDCRTSYVQNQGTCIKCNEQNGCNPTCQGSQIFDPLNQICVDSFNIEKQSLQNLLLSSRIMNLNNDMVVTPQLSPSNQIIHCYIDVNNNPMTLYSFIGGSQFTSSTSLTKSWTQIPKGYQKSVSFTVLFYGNGNPTNLQVKINSNLATLENNYQTVTLNQISCSGSGTQTQSIFKVKFLIQDYQNFFNLEIRSVQSNWGIRDLNIEIYKCHPTCKSCYLGGSNTDCSICDTQLATNRFQCVCPSNYYAKYSNCFESFCISCQPCSVNNCLKCQDITGYCTQCNPGFLILDGQCIELSQCISPNKDYLNYCGIYNEVTFTHFKQDKIVEYGDIWKFYNQDVSAITCVSSRKCTPIISFDREYTLSINLPNYQNFHFLLEFNIEIAYYYKTAETLLTKTINVQKNSNQFVMKLNSQCNYIDCLTAYSFSQMTFKYYRCHPLCLSCVDMSLSNCINCIQNAIQVNGSCTCKDGFYFTLVRNQSASTPPGSCNQCNSSCKTCNGPSYQECIICSEGYTKIGDICSYNCLDGQYWDQASSSCLDCHPCCRTCFDGSNNSCHDCKQGYQYGVYDMSCNIYNAQCQSCTVAVNYKCGGTEVNHQSCLSDGWFIKDANTCVNCKQFVNGKCGGNQTQEIIEFCIFLGFLNFDSNNCSPCHDVVSFNCGRSEIQERCHSNGWVVQDTNTCINCTKAVNGICSLEQTQESINACILDGYFNYDNNNCSPCHETISNNCGRQEIKERCKLADWEVHNQNICVKCTKYINGSCGVVKFDEQIKSCFQKGFNNYDNENCSSCREQITSKCGRLEINNRCIEQDWLKPDESKCLNCSKNSPTLDQCLCDQSCSTCTKYFDTNACTTCVQSYYFFQNQCLKKCPNGYIVEEQNCIPCTEKQMPTCFYCYKTCFMCDILLEINNPNSCIRCSNETRQLVNGQCQCLDSEDQRQNFFECSYKKVAVLDAILSNIDSILAIDFGKQIIVQGNFQQDQLSIDLCLHLFTKETIQLLGTDSQCSFLNKHVYVRLDIKSNVFHGDFIYFKKNILSFSTSPSELIQKYYNNVVIQDKIIGESSIIFDYNAVENSCVDFNIKYNKVINGANRDVYKSTWSFISFEPQDLISQPVVENLLKKANLEKNLNLNIPKGIIKPGVQLTIKLDYTLKSNVDGFKIFPLNVKIVKLIMIDVQSTIQNPFYRHKSGLLTIYSVVKICPNTEEILSEPQKFQISSQELPEINFINSSYQQQYYQIELKPYTLKPGTLVINVNSILVSDHFVEESTKFKINIEQSQLLIKIIGSNSQMNYKNSTQINSQVRDYDIQSEQDPQEIQLTWQCIFPSEQTTCVDKDGDQVLFSPGQSTITIEAFTFNPYTVIKIVLLGEKQPNRSYSDQKILFFTEQDLPPLNVQIQINDLLQETVNINEEIYVKIQYFTQVNVDLLSFSGTIQYDNNIVGIIKFDYMSLRFQIWNYFNNIKKNVNEIQMRFNVFNPLYYMPSMTTNTLKLNLPPINCNLVVHPMTGGFSLETLYSIQFEGCSDDNLPIQYQYYFYKTMEELEHEKKYPLQVKRRQLNDKSQNYFIQTSLPYGQILILGQAIDSKSAIYNTTVNVEVQQKIYSVQEYQSIIQQKIDNLKKQSTIDAITSLSILCDDILQRKEFQTNSYFNQQKMEIVNQLKSLKQNLPTISSFSTAADKAIVSIFQSGIVYSQSELSDQLSSQIEGIDQSSDLQKFNLESSLENQKQKNYDQFQMIDSLGKSGLDNNTQSVDQILQLTDKIGKSLFKNILPNEEPIQFKGQFVNIHAKQITEKYLCEYFQCEQLINQIDSQKQSTIYNFKKTEYQDNPYSQDSSFLNYTDTLKKQNPDLKIESYPIIEPKITTIQNDPINTFSKQININFKTNTDNEEQKKVCLSKDQSNEWTKSGCITMYNQKLKSYSCICDDLSPTTIINDLGSLFTDSNANTVFSSDGISNIANFSNFYEYSIFWVLASLTSLFISLYIIGALLDNIDINQKKKNQKFNQQMVEQQLIQQISQKSNKVTPLNMNSNIIKNKDFVDMASEDKQSESKQLDCSPNLIFSQSILLKENNDQVIDLNSSGMSKLTLAPNTPSSEQVNFQIKLSQFSNRNPKRTKVVKTSNKNSILNHIESNNIVKKEPNQDTLDLNSNMDQQENNILINVLQDQNTQSTCVQQNDPKQNDPKQDSKFLSFRRLSFLKQIIIFHNFFGVFIVYNHQISRKVRFFIFYVRSIHSVSISLFFDKSYSIIQQVIISIMNAILIILIIKIMEKVIFLKGKVGYFASKIIILAILFGYFYIILAITGGQTVDESNKFILSFGILYGGDIFGVSFVFAIISKMIAVFLIKNREVQKGFKKMLYKLLELQLVLLNAEMD